MSISSGAPVVRPKLRLLGTGVVLLGVVALLVAAWASGMFGVAAPPAEFDAFVNLGARAGTEALERDLNHQHPAGTDLVPLLARLQRAGFDCRPDARVPTTYGCLYNRMMPDRRVARIEATIRSDGLRVLGIVPVLAVSAR